MILMFGQANRTQDPSFSQSQPFLGCFIGTFNFVGRTVPGLLSDPPQFRRHKRSIVDSRPIYMADATAALELGPQRLVK